MIIGSGQRVGPPARVVASAILAAALVLLPAEGASASPRERSPAADQVPDRYIVVFRGSAGDAGEATDRRERRDRFRARFVYRRAVKGFSAKLSRRQVERLESDPSVAFVSPDREVQAVGAIAPGESAPTGVRRIGAASSSDVRSASGVNVAVIDTGIDPDHPDLNTAPGKNCVGSAAPDDDNGHGTHVAGSIAARNNGSGVVGVAPDTKVYAAKVLDFKGEGTWSEVICGVDWVTSTRSDADAGNDIAVANMSVGGGGPPIKDCATTTDALHKALCNSTQAGVHYVVAAGNSGWDFDYAPVPDVPAAYPQVLTVTAASDSDGIPGGAGGAPTCRADERDDHYASFSNYAATAGGEAHTIAAPGICISSTWPGGDHRTVSGTSMASPHVAGAVALCLNEGGVSGPCSGLPSDGVITRMRGDARAKSETDSGYGFTGDPRRPVSGSYFGYLGWVTPPPARDTTPPSATGASPSDGATGIDPAGNVSVTFSEPMDRAATEQAFSLAPARNQAAKVAGSFSWTGDTMTFDPASDLGRGVQYVASVGSGARDAAGNPLPARSWRFTTRTHLSVTAFPSATTTLSGSLRGGGAARLGADDNSYFRVNSTTSGTRTTDWYGRVTSVANALSNLRITYRGASSRTCTQRIYIRRFDRAPGWVQLHSRSVGTSEVGVSNLAPGGPAADYVSGTSGDGELRVRIRCTRSSPNFNSSGDLLRVNYDRP